LSIGAITNKKCTMIFGPKICWIVSTKNPFEVLATWIKDKMNGLYKLEITNTQTSMNLLEENTPRKLWHRHLRH
jgi:hypothetical protein